MLSNPCGADFEAPLDNVVLLESQLHGLGYLRPAPRHTPIIRRWRPAFTLAALNLICFLLLLLDLVLELCGVLLRRFELTRHSLSLSCLGGGPLSLRLAFPPEFDLMARLAGLRLRDRWGGWTGEPFTPASWRHVSVYHRSPETHR